MAHYYQCTNNPFLREDIQTPAQARKHRCVYPSVTTVLGIVKDSFLDEVYKPRKMVELAREDIFSSWQDIAQLTYGLRPHPSTGEMMPSSEFGTAVHQRIENLINAALGGNEINDCPFEKWARPFLRWIEDNEVTALATEYLISDRQIKIAGSIDFIGKDKDGAVFLADYKCRSNTNGKAKVYDKDCEQLAIEAFMLQKKYSLEYTPKCRSVIIDCETAEHMHHEWSPEAVKMGIANAKLLAKLFWNKRMKKGIK
jgi:hypothetical protein